VTSDPVTTDGAPPNGLHPSLAPLGFLVGTWRGEGVGGYPGIDDFPYAQELSFVPLPGKPAMGYSSRTWRPDTSMPLATEVGFWRMAGPDDDRVVELMLAHPFGIVEVYVGSVRGTTIELTSNVTVRTATARQVERSERLYGMVEGDLAYAVDMAAEGHPLTPHLSARLSRS